MKKIKALFVLLAALLVICMMPFGAFAIDDEATEESASETMEEIKLAARYTAGGNITVYNYYHSFFVISEMNCIDGSPFLTSKSSWPGNTVSDWGSCGGTYNLFYCLDFYAHGNANGATTKPGTPIEKTPAWQAISREGQKGIQLALIYGVPNCDAYYDNVYGYEATQIIIWEYQLGVRKTANDNVTFFNTSLSRYPQIKAAYDAILTNIRNHQSEPSFDGKTIELKAIGETNAITLTDSNGTFKNDRWSASGSHDGVEVRQNGNNLKVWATKTGGTVNVKLERSINVATGNALCAFTGNQSCVTGVADDPLFATLNVKLPSTGKLKIVKSAPSGMSKSNIRFDIFEGYTNLSNGKVFASIYTNSTGEASADGLQDGKTYYVREVVPENSAKKPAWTITGVEKSGTSADVAWFTAVAGATVQINCKNDWVYASAEITKVTDDGKNISDRVFWIYDSWGNYESNTRFAEIKTNGVGKANVTKLLPDHTYYVVEKTFLPNEDTLPDWELEGSDDWKTSKGDGTRLVVFKARAGANVKIVCINHTKPLGEIEVDKLDECGKVLKNAKFLLEWKDGSTWKAVQPATDGTVGTCTSEGLSTDGTLTTDENGKAIFTGLRVLDDKGNAVRYRLTETAAPNGLTLLAAPIFEGTITENNYISLRAVDSERFALPFTGSTGFPTVTIGILCMGAALFAVFFVTRKKTN